jgi:predicted nucleic acid-binding protein
VELIADTTFLVGLWRRQAWAVAFATSNSRKSIGIPWIVLGEFWYGAVNAGHDYERVTKFLEIGIPITESGSFIDSYARICSALQQCGEYRQIGQNDLWIAAVAKNLGCKLVTKNVRHFDKIEGVQLEILEHENQ